MDTREELSPAVRSILKTADGRSGGDEPLSVTPRSLPDAIARAERRGRVPIVAEVKPTSPTTDGERTEDPVSLAKAMVDGGAAALSVLTEPDHFGGSPETLEAVRSAVDVPVLRKDFILREDQFDVVEADLALIIARFVNDLEGMIDAARDRGFQVLVETHTATEFEAAVAAGAEIVGVNNRDLATLSVDMGTFERVVKGVPESARESVTLIAESGITSLDDVSRMRAAGADALLVGTAIMDGNVRANTERLTDA